MVIKPADLSKKRRRIAADKSSVNIESSASTKDTYVLVSKEEILKLREETKSPDAATLVTKAT